jgi:hypothetical protein
MSTAFDPAPNRFIELSPSQGTFGRPGAANDESGRFGCTSDSRSGRRPQIAVGEVPRMRRHFSDHILLQRFVSPCCSTSVTPKQPELDHDWATTGAGLGTAQPPVGSHAQRSDGSFLPPRECQPGHVSVPSALSLQFTSNPCPCPAVQVQSMLMPGGRRSKTLSKIAVGRLRGTIAVVTGASRAAARRPCVCGQGSTPLQQSREAVSPGRRTIFAKPWRETSARRAHEVWT